VNMRMGSHQSKKERTIADFQLNAIMRTKEVFLL
jgi:hypothetical protein